jgi:hypothetical protein
MKHTIEKLQDLAGFDNGVVGELFRQKLSDALFDLNDRPTTNAARTIVITMSMAPEEIGGALCGVYTEIEVKTTVPPSRTRTISMGKLGIKALVWDDLSPDEHRQETLSLENKE